mgnify:CR=1 FL=1
MGSREQKVRKLKNGSESPKKVRKRDEKLEGLLSWLIFKVL